MPAADPVLVIHGVATRSQEGFNAQIAHFQEDLQGPWKLIPVFWGDLGADDRLVDDTVPGAAPTENGRGEGTGEREEGDPASRIAPPASPEASTTQRPSDPATQRPKSQPHVVAQAAADEIRQSPLPPVRSEQTVAPVRRAIHQALPRTDWLKLLQNPQVLDEIGRTVGLAVRDFAEASAGHPQPHTLQGFTKGLVNGLDNSVGALLNDSVGSVERTLRSAFLPGITRFMGDVFVYQRQRDAIYQRVWSVVKEQAPGYGVAGQPISVIGYSLGGVISFDTAVSAQPEERLWIRNLVTLGSQPAFFQVLDPGRDNLPPYAPGQPIKLPESIGAWTNLWEPLDPLAFLAGRVFQLHDGASPTDVEVPHQALAGLWPHGVYWSHPVSLQAIRKGLTG